MRGLGRRGGCVDGWMGFWAWVYGWMSAICLRCAYFPMDALRMSWTLSGGVTYINLTFDKRRKKGDRKKSPTALNWAQRDPLTHIHTHTGQPCCLSVIEFQSLVQPSRPVRLSALPSSPHWKPHAKHRTLRTHNTTPTVIDNIARAIPRKISIAASTGLLNFPQLKCPNKACIGEVFFFRVGRCCCQIEGQTCSP